MRFFSADDIAALLPPGVMIETLRAAFQGASTVPVRHQHRLARPGEDDATLLVMPAWTETYLGVKIVNVFPGNAGRHLPAVQGVYFLSDGTTGQPLLVADGAALTSARTAAASALAADHLARRDAETLVIVGAGAVARALVAAHAAIRPIRRVLIWNRTHAGALRLAGELAGTFAEVRAVETLQGAVREGDIVASATLAHEPLIRGEWLKAGAHLDLVGGYTPQMREADDAAVTRARLYCDTRDGALHEAGDLIDPIRRGVIGADALYGDLYDLCRGTVPGRTSEAEITLFKSVGTALEDLAAAAALQRAGS